MLLGVSLVLVLAVGYAMWQGVGLLGCIFFRAATQNREEWTLPYPFGVTLSKAAWIQKVLYYTGLVAGVFLFLAAGRTAAFLGVALFFFTGFALKKGVDLWVSHFKGIMKKELPLFLDTFLSLYQSGAKMEQALGDSLTITKALAPVFQPVFIHWHDRGGPEVALERLRTFNLPEIKTCATMLTQVARGGERSVEFLKEWKTQLAEMAHLDQEAGSATKPIIFTALLFLPFGASIVTWFYPFFIQAMHMFDGFLGT